MGLESLIFLSSGLFMGWSLGANDAANIFGTAVGTRMIRFRTAALVISVFVLLGAVFGGTVTTEGLGALVAVIALPVSFVVSFAAGFTVMWMTRLGLPVSTTQAIVGAIVGWNLYSGNPTDMHVLTRIAMTWFAGPLLAALCAIPLYLLLRRVLEESSLHLIWLDRYTRIALIIAGAFGAYSLGKNNIANVMGVFVPSFPVESASLFGMHIPGVQLLFLLGGIAIAAGVVTFSKRVMMTIGKDLFELSPITAFIVILSTALVLFLFASQGLHDWLVQRGLPALPLVPVSQSQGCVGAVLGISIAKGGRNINFKLLRNIVAGWAATPAAAGLLSFILLFFMENIFLQQVYY
mgnify:CR=1 FL=1